MVQTIGITDQCVRHGTQIKQAIPVRIIAGQARDFETEHMRAVTFGEGPLIKIGEG